jgi:hypothetical protein
MNKIKHLAQYELFLNEDTYENQRPFNKDSVCNMTDFKIALCKGRINLSDHAIMDSAKKRGYSSRDIEIAIWTGVLTEFQHHRFRVKSLIEGFDEDKNPICVVLGLQYQKGMNISITRELFQSNTSYKVVTLFPPIKEKFLRKIA